MEAKLLLPLSPEQQGYLAIDPGAPQANRSSEERRRSRPNIDERHHPELW
jgi:hypothetical protein